MPDVDEPQDDDGDDLGLVQNAGSALRASHPLPLLSLASALLAAVDPRHDDPFDDSLRSPVSRETLLESFLEVRRPETAALLNAIAELTDDEVEHRRIRRELAERPGKPPRWLRRLAPLRVPRVVEMTHVLGDGDNLMLDVVTGNGDAMCVLAYIDHNMGTLVKDAFVVDEPLAVLEAQYREMVADEPDTTFTELDLADARARITEAIELGAMTYPPFETETWPACQPLVEWVVRHLPTGGTGYVRPEWSEEDRDALVDRFVASSHAPDVPEDVAVDLADVLVWFACDYGPGDPLRWSPVSVEILLTDFLPRKAVFSPAELAHGPDVLAAFVRFAHDERGIQPELTDDTLQAIDEHAPQFLAAIDHGDGGPGDAFSLDRHVLELLAGHGGAEGPSDALLALLGGAGGYQAMMRDVLVGQVGGEQALEDLDEVALPDEPMDLTGVPEDVHERVARTAALTDACCEELLDVEHRTACRRLLVDVAAADPAIFRRRSSDERAAAAVAWIITKANDTLEPYSDGGLTATVLIGWFGLSGSVSQRAGTMLEAIDAPATHAHDIRLGSARYLVADARAEIIARRDALSAVPAG